jgi:CBS domain containing-hemolysin-like protein
MNKFGKKKLFFYVMVANFLSTFTLTVCSFIQDHAISQKLNNQPAAIIMIICLLLYNIWCGLAISTVTFVICGEVLPKIGIAVS